MVTEKIPESLSNHPHLKNFVVEPPNTGSYSISKLVSAKLDTIEGENKPLGYSTAASTLELELTSNKNTFAVKIELPTQNSTESTLLEAIATKLLLHILYSDIVKPKHYKDVSKLISTYVPKYQSAIEVGISHGFAAAASMLLPHLAQMNNYPHSKDIRANKSVKSIRENTEKTSLSLKDALQVTRDAVSPNFGILREVVLFDVSQNTRRSDLLELVSQATAVQMLPMLIGPSDQVTGILPGQSTELRWDRKSLLELSAKALNEISEGEFNSLSAIASREVRAMGSTPEHIMIQAMQEAGVMQPGVLIRAINQFLPIDADSNQISMTSFEKVVRTIRTQKI